jgi:hypothetical protein
MEVSVPRRLAPSQFKTQHIQAEINNDFFPAEASTPIYWMSVLDEGAFRRKLPNEFQASTPVYRM